MIRKNVKLEDYTSDTEKEGEKLKTQTEGPYFWINTLLP